MAAGIRIPEGQLEDSSDYPQAVCDSHLSAYSSDCPSDTQPLLAVPKVRVQSSPVSSDLQLCLDNSLARFPYRSEDSASCRKSSREESNGHNATTVLIPPAASSNSTGETPRLGVVVTASSPTGSDTLAAPPLSELYRYHVFFSHCAQDVAWVQSVVERLQDSPYNYRCAFSPDLEQDRAALEQNLLCSAMLSERVILVLSRQYVKETWYVFEKILRQLTQMSLHNQRIMGVLLEDCVIPESLGELYFLDTSDPDFFEVFTKRLKSGVVNGQTLAQCTLAVKVGWDSYLQVVDTSDELPPSLKSNGINLERPEYCAIVHNVSTVLGGSNKLPWVLCVQPLVALLMAAALWLPAFITVLVLQVDDNSGMALPVRLVVFVFPLGIVSFGYLLKWRRRYWLSKIVRILVQNCVKMNQLLYCEGRPILTTAGHVRANNFAVYFVYFDLTDCVRSVDLLLFTCLEDDWDKLMRLVEFYTRDKSYLAQVSMSERLTVMMAAAYLLKLVRCVLPHPPQQRHIGGQLCLCQFTEECVTRFVHALDREDVPALAELFTRHLFGYVSGSAVQRINKDLFHRLHATGQ
ncbi:uncharacterized protein LOC112574230 isoform X2 [Pomacea canaliculata]|uniref:uncharacterized protein LOC112574230 isoform X2 n=1 Tax=Pomacea canaliculata TaxID=400727 RepID=UPI000D72DE21|nr:uncharacterized protein LOC112574230 isoform X2 [Pomacea canaliculata]